MEHPWARTVDRIKTAVVADPRVKSVVDVRTLVLGADDALVAIDVVFEPETTVTELEAVVDRIESRIRVVVPGARCYIEAESLTPFNTEGVGTGLRERPSPG